MRLARVSSLLFVAILAAQLSPAQQAYPPQREWTPQGLDVLRQGASSKTEFTLDHSMLVLASKLDANNEDLRRVIAGVSGVSVHNYRYSRPWMYDSETLESVKEEYRAAGWKQLMNNHDKNGGAGVTDLWIRLENNAISNVAILVARASEVDFFVVSGSISPIDLSHLGGHFGITKIEGGVVVPTTAQR
jgi:hypothetical protein